MALLPDPGGGLKAEGRSASQPIIPGWLVNLMPRPYSSPGAASSDEESLARMQTDAEEVLAKVRARSQRSRAHLGPAPSEPPTPAARSPWPSGERHSGPWCPGRDRCADAPCRISAIQTRPGAEAPDAGRRRCWQQAPHRRGTRLPPGPLGSRGRTAPRRSPGHARGSDEGREEPAALTGTARRLS
jgi:hypothetical protein